MRYPAEVLTRQEVGRLLDACGTRTWTDRRNRALIVVLYRAGLRLAGALALRPCDVDLNRGAIRVLKGKGGKARTVGIDRWRLTALAGWMEEHRARGWSGGDPLFCSGSGKPVTQAYIRRRLPELGRTAGIHKRLHAHGLRHTHAAELRVEGIDLAVIRRQLGHASLLTTVRYLDHLEPESVINIVNRRNLEPTALESESCHGTGATRTLSKSFAFADAGSRVRPSAERQRQKDLPHRVKPGMLCPPRIDDECHLHAKDNETSPVQKRKP